MPAAYDYYDYPSYWEGREYEHESEIIALKTLLGKVPKVDTLLEIGSGFGRLTPAYSFRARRILLADPSAKLMKMARKLFPRKRNVRFIQAKLENLNPKVRKSSVDLVILVRVIHHLEDPDEALKTVSCFIKKGGFLILEFANKSHIKATFSEFLKGNFTFPFDIFPKEVSCRPSRKKTNLPFLNFHPAAIEYKLKNYGFQIIEKRSVSNIRSPFIKKIFPKDVLLYFEKILQKPLSFVNFGPSIFILAQKRFNKRTQ